MTFFNGYPAKVFLILFSSVWLTGFFCFEDGPWQWRLAWKLFAEVPYVDDEEVASPKDFLNAHKKEPVLGKSGDEINYLALIFGSIGSGKGTECRGAELELTVLEDTLPEKRAIDVYLFQEDKEELLKAWHFASIEAVEVSLTPDLVPFNSPKEKLYYFVISFSDMTFADEPAEQNLAIEGGIRTECKVFADPDQRVK